MADELALAIRRFDLLSYVQEHGGERDGRTEYLLVCPRCGRRKLSVNVARGRWRCFVCQVEGTGPDGRPVTLDGGGGVFGLVQWVDGLAPRDAAQAIIQATQPPPNDGRIPDSRVDVRDDDAVPRQPTGLPKEVLTVTGILPYMDRRAITLADARMFGLGYVPPHSGWLSHRLVFPVWWGGQCLYWQARACWDEKEHVPRWPGRHPETGEEDRYRKTLNPAAERHGVRYLGSSDVLGNLEQACRYPRVALVEGPTSGIRVGPDAVWSFGKSLSARQVALLVRAGVRAVDFMWDGPGPHEPHGAWPKMFQHAPMLAAFMDVRLVFIPRGDPGDYSREQNAQMRAQGRPWDEAAGRL